MPEHDEIDPLPTPVEFDAFKEGVTLHEARRAMVVRTGFIAALVTDPRVIRRFAGWLGRLREYRELALASGAEPPDVDFGDEFVHLVRDELAIKWPWVLSELTQTLYRMNELNLIDPVKAVPPPAPGSILAPSFKVEVEAGSGVALEEARAELLHWLSVLDEMEAAANADSSQRAAKEDTSYLLRWGRWYYEVEIGRPARKIRPIAAEYHVAAGHPGRFQDHGCGGKGVREALKKAKRLLSLGEYTF